jgi:hypothetical protein
LSVLGYVLNCPADQSSLATETNREVLLNSTGVPCLAELPFIAAGETEGIFPMERFQEEFALSVIEPILFAAKDRKDR